MTLPQHILGRALWLAAGAVLVWALLRRDEASAVEAQWQAQVKSYAAFHWLIRGYQGEVASVTAGAHRLADSITHVQVRADSSAAVQHRAFLDALAAVPATTLEHRTLLSLQEKCDAAIQESRQVNSLCRQQTDSLRRLATLYFAMYQATATRNAHGDSLIAAGFKAADTHHFHVAFVTLPKPKKWQVALVGCAAGAFLDQARRLEGCAAAGLVLTVASPTW